MYGELRNPLVPLRCIDDTNVAWVVGRVVACILYSDMRCTLGQLCIMSLGVPVQVIIGMQLVRAVVVNVGDQCNRIMYTCKRCVL